MLLVAHPQGRVAVAQPSHGWMCGQLGRAWGNELAGTVEPYEEVVLAAEQHDAVWTDWELAPTLDRETGLPHAVFDVPMALRLEMYDRAPGELAVQSRYAALLVSLFRVSFFDVRESGEVGAYLARARAQQAELRATLAATDDEIGRNWHLLRVWDTLSLDLLVDRIPRVREGVPAAGGGRIDVTIDRRGPEYTLDPWPFRDDRVVLRTEGRLLERRFDDEQRMREALQRAPWVDLEYELVPTGSRAR